MNAAIHIKCCYYLVCTHCADFWRDVRLKDQESTHKDEKVLKQEESKYIRRGNQKTVAFLKGSFANLVIKYNNVTKQKAYLTVNKTRGKELLQIHYIY